MGANKEAEMVDENNPDSYIICPICFNKYSRITWKHIRNHGLNTKEFKIKYPELKSLSSLEVFNKISNKSREVMIDKWNDPDAKNEMLNNNRKMLSEYKKSAKYKINKSEEMFNNKRKISLDEWLNCCNWCRKMGTGSSFCIKSKTRSIYNIKNTKSYK
jgi:hypothetical protein